MDIVFIQKFAGRGGSKNSLAESLAALSADGSVRLRVISSEKGQFTERCGRIGVPVTITPLPEWRKFFDRLRFKGAIRSIARNLSGPKPDWIISNEMWWAPQAAALSRELGCRSAVILRDGIATIRKSLQYRLQDHELILPVSSTIAEALTPHPEFSPKVHVLFNSVSVPAENPEDTRRLDQLLQPYPDVRRWLLVVGKLSPRKNQVDAVHVLRSLTDAGHAGLGLLLAGDIEPDYLPQMEKAISTHGLQDRVAMIGNFEGLSSLLERADTLLLPSFREGLPRSLVEAVTAGKPAFAFPCEGVEDIYGGHLPTFVSAESTAASLTAVIRHAWENPESTSAAFAKVREHVLRQFSPQEHARRLLSLLSGSGRTPSR
ncbi:MAG: glycosyltransferase family 4 protein [Akkermansiaceae bacterium]|nr:glycosyltransferase family 4 protein [Akkermansiaceae bacterium]